MHLDMQLCGPAHVRRCTDSLKHTAWSSRFGPKSLPWYHMCSRYTCTGEPRHHLSVCARRLPFFKKMCVCVVFDKRRERESKGSDRQLYFHLCEQIPVGRTAEEDTSCLTYFPFKAVIPCAVLCQTYTNTLSLPASCAASLYLRHSVVAGQQLASDHQSAKIK